MLAESELRALLHLCALPGVGNGGRLRALLRHYGSARAALSAPATAIGEAAALVRDSAIIRRRVESSLRAVLRPGVEILLETDPRYPARLLHLEDPPAVLFARGRLELLERPAIAVVGTRQSTEYGGSAARLLAGGLSRAGVVVVSGLARGIDAHAHAAALEGGTIAVLAGGIDVAYPVQNTWLYERIAREGLLLSEAAPGTPAMKHLFPRRNRLIAALALGVTVVEASARSGALITADHALRLGREVLAVPGPIGRATSIGTNALLRDGATPAIEVRDILEAVGLGELARRAAAEDAEGGERPPPPVGLSPIARALWEALGHDPMHVDELADACGAPPSVLLGALLELELAGHARQVPGGRYTRA
ncbi:MAG TPA: DNA-processing protein DprA [Longimicrobiales bacterium]